jgi:hypothetical protein
LETKQVPSLGLLLLPAYFFQALAKQFAELLQFVLAFDEQKLKNPSIQNDFSYYRRTLSRLKMNEIA